MSIYSSLYAGVSGLTALGNSMSVIGDNIANVNTTGFKGSRATFQDILNTTVTTGNGTTQVGQGTVLSDVSSAFSQAGFETTDSITDVAIDGEGFFVLSPENSEQKFYSRAGAFSVDANGKLINAAGHIVQGYKVHRDSTTNEVIREGTYGDIVLNETVKAPEATDKITLYANLNSSEQSKSEAALNEAAVATDGTWTEDSYSHSSTIKVYDSKGNDRDLTIYFDKTAVANQWELIVASPTDGAEGSPPLDVWAYGTIDFDSKGVISTVQLTSDGVSVSTDGYWQFPAFNTEAYTGTDATTGQEGISALSLKLDLGVTVNADGTIKDTAAVSTSQYASESVNMYQSATGYGRGEIQDMSIDKEGVINAVYSNGETLALYQICLARFNNNQGLEKLGGSVFRESNGSGPPAISPPNTNGLGELISSSLEQSTVDIAVEFVKMITTQRGYQANSKTILTTDQMIQTVVNLKR